METECSSKSPSFRLDCPAGLRCKDYECELLHLDEVEQAQQQQQQRQPANTACAAQSPLVVVTASPDMGRTASTWVFNAVRLLYRAAAEAAANHHGQPPCCCDSYWIRALSADKIQQRRKRRRHNNNLHVVLIKTHEWTPYVEPERFRNDILPLLDRIIVSLRAGFAIDPAWLDVATHVVQYEHIVADNSNGNMQMGALRVLRDLAGHLDIPDHTLSDEAIRRVDYQLMTLPIPGNQATKFWSFHARRGGRAVPSTVPKSDR